MKKFLSFLFVIALICAFLSLPSFAEGSGILALSGGEGKPGDTVNVDVNLNSNPGLISMKFTISWAEGLELVSVSNSGLLNGWTAPTPTIASPYTLRWADALSGSNNDATGKIATLVFRIKQNADRGNLTVNLNFLESFNVVGAKNTFSNADARVIIGCPPHEFGSPEPHSDTEHTRICTICGEEAQEPHAMNQRAIKKEANCKEAGLAVYECTLCKFTKEEVIPQSQDHAFGEWKVVQAASCDSIGKRERECTLCKKAESAGIPASGHNMTDPVVHKEPTCTLEGEREGYCTICKIKTRETLKANGHSFGDGVVLKEATENEAGKMKYTCSVCGETKEEEIPILESEPEILPNVPDTEGMPAVSTRLIPQKKENHPVIAIILLAILAFTVFALFYWYFVIKKR